MGVTGTKVRGIGAGSPAIDAGNPAGCEDEAGEALTTDQRGEPRPQGTRCDIGAFETARLLLDHFLCYKAVPAKGQPKFSPHTVTVDNRTSGAERVVRSVKLLRALPRVAHALRKGLVGT